MGIFSKKTVEASKVVAVVAERKPTFEAASKVFTEALKMFRQLDKNNQEELKAISAKKNQLETEQEKVAAAIKALSVFESK